MPQGNDLKDAKDIDPLGMTRDLFGQRPVDEAVTAAPGSQELQHPEDTHVGADDHAADNVSVGDDDDAARDDESLDVTASDEAPDEDDASPGDAARVSSLKEEMTRELRTLLDDLAEPVAESDPKADVPSP